MLEHCGKAYACSMHGLARLYALYMSLVFNIPIIRPTLLNEQEVHDVLVVAGAILER